MFYVKHEYLLNSFEIKKKQMFYVKHEEFICALFTKLPDTKCQISLGLSWKWPNSEGLE